MRKLRHLIPSGNLLYTFEAAARHESFTIAATELNVTAAAVSHAIRQLESSLGLRLFERLHRKVKLTGDGAKLFHSVAIGLEHVLLTAQELKQSSKESHVRLSVSIAIATYWLLPRLTQLRELHPNIDLHLYTTDQALDLAADGCSLGITSGRGNWEGHDVWLFARERIYPVCSPAYLSKYGPIKKVEDLLDHTLIYQDDRIHDGITWSNWLSRFGQSPRRRESDLEYGNYALVIRAATEGQGVALGWHHLVADLVERGDLVRPIDATISSSVDFYIVARKGQALEPDAALVRDWLALEGTKMWPTDGLDFQRRAVANGAAETPPPIVARAAAAKPPAA